MIGCCAPLSRDNELLDAGFSFIEPKFSDLQTSSVHHLPVYAVNNLIPRNLSFFGPNSSYSEIKHLTESIFRTARANQTKILTLGSGKCRTSKAPKKDREIWIDYLYFIESLCSKNNLQVGIEPLAKEETNFINTIEETIRFLDEAKFPHVGITADIYHFNKEKDSLKTLEKYISKVVHVHISDENRDFPCFINPNLKSFLKTLSSNGYKGAVSIEIDWKKELIINSEIVYELQKMGF